MMVFLLDLRRTARRGQPALLRAVYALALLAALGGLFVRSFPGALAFDPQVVARETGATLMARFAGQFAAVCAAVQLGAVLLLAPAATAGAIAEERQRGTLDLLLTSDLTAFEIVLGKLAARTLHLFALLLTGVPVLALAQLWGGVEPEFVAASFAVNALTLVSLGALGLFCSTLSRTVPGATAATYTLALFFGITTYVVPALSLVNPIVLYGQWLTPGRGVGDNWLGPLSAYAAFHLAAAGLFTVVAARSLRTRLFDIEKVVRAAMARWHPVGGLSGDLMTLAHAAAPLFRQPVNTLMPGAASVRVFPPPPIGPRPLLWKELHFGGSATAGELFRSAGCLILLIEAMVAVVLMAFVGSGEGDDQVARELRKFFASLVVTLNSVLCLGVLLSAAGSVSRERERHTLDALLTLPGGRTAALEAKWLGSLLRVRWLAAGLVPAWVLVLVGGGLSIHAAPYLTAAVLVHASFCASLGLCVSVWTRGTGRAVVTVVGAAIVLSVVPPLMSGTVAGLAAPYVRLPTSRFAIWLETGLSPPLMWWRLSGDERRWARLAGDGDLTPMLFGLLAYAVAALLLVALAHHRFGREWRR